MATGHVKSNTVADFTGTVTVFDNAGVTQTLAATNLVRPSDWNSVHSHIVTLGGNTVGASTISGTNIVYNGGNNITVSGAQGANAATIVVSAGNYLTTAMASDAATLSNIRVSAGATSNLLSAVTFANANGLAFGLDAGTITGSYTVPAQFSGGASNLGNTAGDTGVVAGRVVFVGSDNITLSGSTNGGSATISLIGAGGLLASSMTVSDAATSGTLARLAFTNQNGVTLSLSTGLAGLHTIVGSHNALTSQSNQAFSADASSTFQTLSFQNSNGFTFSNNAGAIRASYSVPVVSNAIASVGSATNSGTNTSRFAADDHVHAGVFSMGVSTGGNIAGDTRVDVGRFVLAGGANITLSQATAANALNTISIVGPAPGAAAITQTIGISNITQGGSTAGTTGGVTGDDIQFVFVPGSNITMSQSINGSSGTLSIFGPSGGAATIGGWEPIAPGNNTTFSSLGQNSVYLQKVIPDVNYSFNNLEFRMSGSFVSSTNSQVAVHSIRYGLYSLETNNSYNSLGTSSIIISASFNSNTAMGYTISQGAASFTTSSGGTAIASLMSGQKHLYLPFTSTITAGGNYAVAVLISSATTVGTSPFRMALLNQSIINNLTIGKVHATTILASNSTFVGDYNQGVYNTTTGVLPAAIAKSQMTNAISQARLYFQFEV